jgi:tetratricopeptide (TPR) repeat protein
MTRVDTRQLSARTMNETTKEISKLLEQAITAEDQKDIERARKLYQRCLELDDGSDSAPLRPERLSTRLRARLLHIEFLRAQGNIEQALSLATGSAERWPEQAMVHKQMARCLLAMGRPSEAEHAYRRALAIRPDPGVWVLLAAVIGNELENRGDEAIQCLHEALALDPNYEEAHYNLGHDLRRNGDLEGAIERFRKALAIDPVYTNAHAELGMALVRLSETGRGDADSLFDEALSHLERAVALEANEPKWRLYLAVTLWQADRLRQARVHYEVAVQLDPGNGATLSFYADFLSSAFGCKKEAERRFRSAIELDPENAYVHYYFGKHLLHVGRHAEARRELLLADRLGHPSALPVLQSSDED